MEARKKGLPIWFQVTLPIVTAIIGIVVGWLLDIPTTTFQRRIQKASNDMQRVQVIMEIIDKADPDYLPMLDSLIMTIEDVEIKEAMSWIVETKRRTLEHSKTRVEEKSEPIRKELESSEPSAEEAKPDDTTCVIVYLEGDTVGKRCASILKDFLHKKRKSRFQHYPFKYYQLEPRDAIWIRANFNLSKEINGTNSIAYVYYNDSNNHKNAYRLYLSAMEALSGVVFSEKFSGTYDSDKTNEGNGVLEGCLFTDFGCELLEKDAKLLCGYEYVIVIPPYYLNVPLFDSLYPPTE